MKPRVLFRTHYQVDEPALMEVLVKRCTSPVKTAYSEVVAERMAKEVQKHGKPFNIAAAGYALDLARGLGIVNEQNVWTDKGHLVNVKAKIVQGSWEEQLPLDSEERLLHLRLFLEADGAALLHISRYLVDHESIPNSDDDWNALAKDLFTQIYCEYLKLAGTTADRVALRNEVDRIRMRGYRGKSGPHKMFIHLQTLYRLGLVDRASTAAARRYLIAGTDGGKGLRTLVDAVGDLYTLEKIVKEHRLLDVCAKVLQMGANQERTSREHGEFLGLVVPAYQEVMATGTPLSPLATLIETVQIDLLVNRSEMLPYDVAVELLERLQRESPADVRFHVDRKGVPAYLKLSDQLVASYGQTT